MNSNDENQNPCEPGSGPESPAQISSRSTLNIVTPETLPKAAPRESSTNTESFRHTNRAIPDDLGVPWGWLDLSLLVLIAVAGLVLFWMFIAVGFHAAGITRDQFQHSMAYQGFFAIVAMALMSLFLLAYLAAQMRFRFRSPVWRTLGWRPLETGESHPQIAYLRLIGGGILLSMLVALASSAFTPKNKMPIAQFLQDRHTALLLLIMSVTLAPLFEETIFRGYIYPVVARTFGVMPGIIFTGLIFGLMHASQLGGNVPQVALLVSVGIVFTAARARTGTVLASYLLHVSYNSFIAAAFLIASHGLRHMPTA
jgi:membrane protease YdiL (CAAX protease family)